MISVRAFVHEHVPHITMKSIANNAEIDVILETWQRRPEPLREALYAGLGGTEAWEEWQIPRVAGDPWPGDAVKQPLSCEMKKPARDGVAQRSVSLKKPWSVPTRSTHYPNAR